MTTQHNGKKQCPPGMVIYSPGRTRGSIGERCLLTLRLTAEWKPEYGLRLPRLFKRNGNGYDEGVVAVAHRASSAQLEYVGFVAGLLLLLGIVIDDVTSGDHTP
jgi:hypothetical protein